MTIFCGLPSRAATMADIIGTRSALQCYHVDNTVRCRDLSTGDDWKVFERSGIIKTPWNGSINAGGIKLVCESGRRNCVINLDGSNLQYVSGLYTGNGRFWRDSLGNDWVVYSGEEESYQQAGTVWKVQIDAVTNMPIDSTRTLMLGAQYSCGLNGSGTYLGDVYANAYLYNLHTRTKSTVLYDTTTWWEPPCFYGSIHPADKPWLMFSAGAGLHSVVIARWIESANQSQIIWQYNYPAGTVWAQWSPTDAGVCAVVKDRQLYLVAIHADTTAGSDNTDDYLEAAAGISFPSDTTGIVGGPWIGARPLVAGTPLISPAGGFCAQDTVMVSITTITDSASLYYSIDGTAPTPASTPYTSAFALTIPDTGSVTLSARAYKTGLTESAVAQAVFSRLALRDSTAVSAAAPGLDYEYYEGLFLSPGDILQPWAAPVARGDIDSITIGLREREDEFAVRFSGYFRAPADGKYTFFVTSDDSSELYIGAEKVVSTNYKLGTMSGIVGLKTGMHPLSVLYHQGDGGKELTIECEGPGFSRRPLPPSMLFRPAQPIRVISPAAFDTVLTGSTVAVQWTADTAVASVLIDISINPPSLWQPLITAPVAKTDAAWGNFAWTVPQEVSGARLHDSRISFRVRSPADSTIADESNHTLRVIDPSSIHWRAGRSPAFVTVRQAACGPVVSIPFAGPYRIELVSLNGRIIARRKGNGPAEEAFDGGRNNGGVYILRVVSSNSSLCSRIVLSR